MCVVLCAMCAKNDPSLKDESPSVRTTFSSQCNERKGKESNVLLSMQWTQWKRKQLLCRDLSLMCIQDRDLSVSCKVSIGDTALNASYSSISTLLLPNPYYYYHHRFPVTVLSVMLRYSCTIFVNLIVPSEQHWVMEEGQARFLGK